MTTKKVTRAKSREQVRREFMRRGISFSAWARAHGFSESLVRDIMTGNRKCLRGQSHQVAVMLGLKVGEATVSAGD